MTSENVAAQEPVESAAAVSAKAVDDQLIDELVSQAQAEGLQLTGEGGLLQQLTRRLLESALEGEITDHLGYDKHDPAGKDGGNSRNGKRSKTVLTDVGPVEITVPRDRDGSFEPKIVKKRQKRLTGVDEMVISLAAKGLTTGEVQAHLAEVYGAEVSRQTISTITDSHSDMRVPVAVTRSLTDVLLDCPCFDLSGCQGPFRGPGRVDHDLIGAWPEAP
ncbi:transposase [Streptomyces sp. NBC_00258]|nr:transposase [Streptomyces sp. NBC_00258]